MSDCDTCSLWSVLVVSLSLEATESEASLEDGVLPPSSTATVFAISPGTLVLQKSPDWPGMNTATLRTDEKRMMNPIIMKAACDVICRKQNPKATAPTFPPAPMIPDIDPLNLGLMYGTIL